MVPKQGGAHRGRKRSKVARWHTGLVPEAVAQLLEPFAAEVQLLPGGVQPVGLGGKLAHGHDLLGELRVFFADFRECFSELHWIPPVLFPRWPFTGSVR